MSVFLSCFDLFTLHSDRFGSETAVQDWGQPPDHFRPAPEAEMPLEPPVPDSFHNDPDPDYGVGSRNDTVGVGTVMDTQATTWQDMVWIDWD